MERRGSLHVGLRLEAGFALIAAIISQVNGGKSKPQDFMPHFDRTGGAIDLSGESGTSIQDVFKVMSRAAEHTKEATRHGTRPRKANDEYLSGKE